MRSLPRCSLLVGLAVAVGLTVPGAQHTASASGPIVWVAPSLQRIGPTDPAGSVTTAVIYAGRRETQSFQVAIKAPAGGLTNGNVGVSDLHGPGGRTIAATNLTLYREWYVPVAQHSYYIGGSDGPQGPGWYPDALIPFIDPSTGKPPVGGIYSAVPFTITAGQNQPIWIDVSVPPTATAGLYSGSYTVSSDQGSFSGQIQVTVWDFTLPLQPALKSTFSFSQTGNAAMNEVLLENRVMPDTVMTADAPLLIDDYGLNAIDLGFWSNGDISTCQMDPAPSVQSIAAAKAQYPPGALLYSYTADEINQCPNFTALFPIIKQWARNLHQAGVDNLITIPPTPPLYDDGSGTGRSAVDIWSILPLEYVPRDVHHVQQKGDQVWAYTTLVQDVYSPKWELDYPPINYRIFPGFMLQSVGLTGLLYWRVDYWTSHPWTDVDYVAGGNNYYGEGILVYPGQQVGIANSVVPSMRLKWIRDGVNDYDYIAILKRCGLGAWALGVSSGVASSFAHWTLDPTVLTTARQVLGQAIAAHRCAP